MSISVLCPSCQSKVTGPEKMAGKVVKCPKCRTEMQIPDAAAFESTKVQGQQEIDVELVKAKPSTDAFDFSQDDPPPNPQQSSRQRSSNSTLMIGLAAGSLLMGGLACLAIAAAAGDNPGIRGAFGLVCVLAFPAGLVMMIIWFHQLSRQTCPKCHQVSTPVLLSSQLVAREPGRKTVWRYVHDTKGGVKEMYQEQIHVIREVYENRYRCEVCGVEWTEQSVRTLEA